ncbi:ABC transporter ATP-binding protein [Phytoactinopolyspora limicola]|uniref:ABC transporter ATP-binding protein n=1 Tax=Phytoactinopolyspora limicola TaxID=2715536 RepID=UPI00140DF6FF|nr:sn-glycerol-3-phosphate ABC transporter ATP-binding protein UgpC [Phytoactinopolyspora limicola]
MGHAELRDLTRVFGDVVAVDHVDLSMADGEFVVLVGPSGCGKTTTLRMIAGLETVSSGQILIDGSDVTNAPPRARDIAMVFQSYALYPHMTVARNLSYHLRLRRRPKHEINERVQRIAAALDIEALLDRRPAQLSGGQRQRVALGRAIIREPTLFLMDEPLSNLDAKLRVQTRAEIVALQRRLGVTTVYVTHDQTEAMTMGSKIVVMKDGRVQQIDSPARVYSDPANTFVAQFIGSPAMNLVQVELVPDGDPVRLRSPGGWSVDVPEPLAGRLRATAPERALVMGVRPEDLHLASDPDSGGLPFEVVVIENLGHEVLIDGTVGEHGPRAVVRAGTGLLDRLRPGDRIQVRPDWPRVRFFSANDGSAVVLDQHGLRQRDEVTVR